MKSCSWLLALAVAAGFAAPVCAQQAPAKSSSPFTYTVVKGDTIPTIVRKLKYADVTENQMAYAFVQANVDKFSMNTVDRVLPGMKLTVPTQASVAKVDPKAADNYVENLRKAETLYGEGVGLEHNDDMKGAVAKYIEAAKIGHAFAAYRLGQLYDRPDTRGLPRDFQESMKYYAEARQRGKNVKGPMRRERGI